MDQRIRSIFWLMSLCIIGINAFQGYWLWTTYQLNRQQFSRTVQEALFAVTQQSQLSEANQLFSQQVVGRKAPKADTQVFIHQFNRSAVPGQVRVIITNQADSTSPPPAKNRKPLNTVMVHANRQTMHAVASVQSADTLANRLSRLLVLNWAQNPSLSLRKLSEAYHLELRQRGIGAEFQLDTMRLKPEPTTRNVVIFRTDSLGPSAASSDTVSTSPVPINPVQNLFVKASFATPTFYLLQRMGWLLSSSVCLLFLTTGCFLFMLATILRQKKLSDVKNDFINNMTHELKTPIATVTAAVEAMQHFGVLNDPPKTQTYLSISRTNLQRLSDLVEKVLNLAIEEKRELELRPESILLHELVSGLISGHQLQSAKPVSFTIQIPADVAVRVDRLHFGSALNNLIDNAIKYSGSEVRIRLTYSQTETGWQLAVRDNGIGIPKTYQSVIFDRFFRVPTGNLHPVKGFGLGLAYVRQVIERHGGQISVQSEPGQGSEFLVSF